MQAGQLSKRRSIQKKNCSEVVLGQIQREFEEQKKLEERRNALAANRAGLEVQIQIIIEEFADVEKEFLSRVEEEVFKKWREYGFREATIAYHDLIKVAENFPGLENRIMELMPRLVEAAKAAIHACNEEQLRAKRRAELRETIMQGVAAIREKEKSETYNT